MSETVTPEAAPAVQEAAEKVAEQGGTPAQAETAAQQTAQRQGLTKEEARLVAETTVEVLEERGAFEDTHKSEPANPTDASSPSAPVTDGVPAEPQEQEKAPQEREEEETPPEKGTWAKKFLGF